MWSYNIIKDAPDSSMKHVSQQTLSLKKNTSQTSQNFDILLRSCDVQCWWEYLCFVAFHRNGGINTSGGNGMSGKSTKFEITSDPILKSDPRVGSDTRAKSGSIYFPAILPQPFYRSLCPNFKVHSIWKARTQLSKSDFPFP